MTKTFTKSELKKLRNEFRDSVFKRDSYKCRVCSKVAVDAHHITDRHLLRADGYVTENGISLCADCHYNAEIFNISSHLYWCKNMHPNDLYHLVSSSYELACSKIEKLCHE